MRETLKTYQQFLKFAMSSHQVAESAMERLGEALNEKGYNITEEDLWQASAKIMEAKTKSTIKTISNIQEWLRRRLAPGKPGFRDAQNELEIPPEFMFQVFREKQFIDSMESSRAKPKGDTNEKPQEPSPLE
jgi:hypothetical protein